MLYYINNVSLTNHINRVSYMLPEIWLPNLR